MKLISIKFLNFRRFAKEEVIFWDDFSLVFWKNWAWKSSLLDAIWYSLFWPSSKDFIRVNTEMLKSHFITDRSPSKVELTFQIWTLTYRVVRVIDAWIKKLWDDFIHENKDTLIWSNWDEIIGWTEVTNYITSLIWVWRDTFLRSVFARQKDLEVLSGWKEDRKRLINSILWLDKLEYVVIDYKRELKEKKFYAERINSEIFEFDKEAFLKDLEILKNDFESTWVLLSQKQKYLEEKNNSFKTLQEKFNNISLKQQKFTQIENIIKINISKIEIAKNNVKSNDEELKKIALKEVFCEENKYILTTFEELKKEELVFINLKKDFETKQKLAQEIINLEKEFDILKTQIKAFETEDITKNISLFQEQIKVWVKEFEEINTKKITLENTLQNLKKQGEDLKKEMTEITSLWDKAECPTCKQSLINHLPKLLNSYESQIQIKREEYVKISKDYNDINSLFISLKEKLDTLNLSLEKLLEKEKQYIKILEKVNGFDSILKEKQALLKTFVNINYDVEKHNLLQNKLKDISNQVQIYNQEIWYIKTKVDIENKKVETLKQIEILENEVKNNQNELNNLEFKIEDFNNIKQNYDDFNFELKTLNEEFNSLNKDYLDKKYSLDTKNKVLIDFETKQKEVKTIIDEIAEIELKIDLISNYILYLLDYLKPNIESLASSYFNIITDYKYFEISLDENYNILIDWKTLDLFSGWEKDLANLCLRLALGQNLTTTNTKNSINFLVLDEVLWSQDKQRQQNILANLKKLEHKFSQILLVSHLEDIKEFSTNLIEVKEKNKDESEIIQY